jgi:hypothetical protein
MKIEEMAVDAAGGDDQKSWYRVGSIAAIVLGMGYIVIFPLYARVGAPPSGGEAWFKVPSREDNNLVGDSWYLGIHGLSLRAPRVSPLRGFEKGK